MDANEWNRANFGLHQRDYKGDLLCFDCFNNAHHKGTKIYGCECKCTVAKRVTRPKGKGEQLVISAPMMDVK